MDTKFSKFASYLRCTTNPQWKTILNGMTRGKFPKGFVVSPNGQTIISDDGRKLRINLSDETDQIKLMNEFIALRNFIEASSEKNAAGSSTTQSWKEIKSKEAKYHLISLFAAELAAERSLSSLQEQKLVHQINFCVQLKSFSTDDIEMKGGKISSIKGLKMTKNGEIQMPDIKTAKKSQSSKKKKNIIRLHIEKLVKDNVYRLQDIWGLEE